MGKHELTMPERLLADVESLTYNYGKFIAEPLEQGFGITLGNSLRRVLLSSLRGASIVSARIDGVQHEFSSLPGVVEDITHIVLNLKQVRFRLKHVIDPDEAIFVQLDAQGPSVVTAADFRPNNDLELINPDQYLATLDKDGHLSMEVEIRSGRGYVAGDSSESDTHEIGVTPIDAIYSPVRKASFRVEETRVGPMTNFDKLTLEVWTDGTKSPKDAVTEASQILTEHVRLFLDFDETYVEPEDVIDEDMLRREQYLNKPVAELELSVRSANCLEAAEIVTIRDLVTKSEAEMLKYRNFGRKSLNEIKEIMVEMGLEFGMNLSGSPKRRL